MKVQSVVKWFDPKKGYGFIVHPDGEADIFVHYSAIESDAPFRTLRPDEPVTFVVEAGPKGLHAYEVTSLDPLPVEAPRAPFAAPRAPLPSSSGLPVVAPAHVPVGVALQRHA